MTIENILNRLEEESNTISELKNFEINHNKRGEHLETALYHFTIDFNSLVELSCKADFYWDFCCFDTYKKTFEERLTKFCNSRNELIPLDFYKSEISRIDKDLFNNKPLLILKNIYTPAYITEFDILKENLITQIGITKTRKLEFLKFQVDNYNYEFEVINKPIKPEIINKYPRVFVDVFSSLFFEKMYDEFRNSKHILADFSFIYRKMVYDKLIYQDFRPEMFKSWIAEEPFSIIIDSNLKSLNDCTTNEKEIIYNKIKEVIKKDTTI